MRQAHRIRQARPEDLHAIVDLCCLLWPDCSREEHSAEILDLLTTSLCGTLPAAIFLSEDGAGFLQIGLRSHADGCDPAQPVGFIEGLYVREASRRHGMARALMDAAEAWSREHGAKEMASDTWIDHIVSIDAHQALGFEIVDRCVHFRKPLRG
ncbi:MAG: GNAT family N-acetyltransferase [Edaphobacter sp.]|uniref:GNAT family N-acetyltransferase n=1 Tax=Edaphobacter sp. TaxID=1934404 RepID=UPI0023976C8E|nr:GNAT family N-acetyltransferase [Edaphobacter sp.]MDE1178163.1 GNAT family N-acetyltransferase [Edaphobacter sp.]